MKIAPVYLQGLENVKGNVGVKGRPVRAGERLGAGVWCPPFSCDPPAGMVEELHSIAIQPLEERMMKALFAALTLLVALSGPVRAEATIVFATDAT